MHHPTDRITHTMAFGTPFVEHWLEQEIAQSRKEGNVLFNDVLNTFYLRLFGVRHIVKDYRLHFLVSSKGSFIWTIQLTG